MCLLFICEHEKRAFVKTKALCFVKFILRADFHCRRY